MPQFASKNSVSEGDDLIVQRVGALEKKQDERLHVQHDAELPEARQKQRPERRAEHERDHRCVEDERNYKAVYKRGEDAAGE